MTMDYHHPYNVYPEYYCPSYQGSGYQYPQQQPQHHPHQQQPAHPHSSGPLRNFNNNIIGPPPSAQHNLSHQHQQQQQRPQPYFPPFQRHDQQQHPSSYSSPYVPNFLVTTGTGLTPTLTPTTLATIEQSFMELQNGQQNGGRDPVTQSGFVPPVIDPGHSADVSQDSYDNSSGYSDSEWEPKVKRGRLSQDSKNIDIIVTSTGTYNAAPQRKYTRRNKDEKLSPEEEERRRVRRERNKIAAAKCRQRRVDHTNELVEETEKLEAEQSQLETEIQNLQHEKDQLEFILQAHQPLCKVDPVRSVSSKVKVEPGSHPSSCGSYPHNNSSSPRPENLSMSSGAVSTAAPTTTPSTSSGALETPVITSRPNSLPLIKRDRARMLSVTSATGVTINTPTSGVTITPSALFCPGLDSMVDGSTGLTPLTGMSCSSQVQRNSSDSGSEAVGSPTLISL